MKLVYYISGLKVISSSRVLKWVTSVKKEAVRIFEYQLWLTVVIMISFIMN